MAVNDSREVVIEATPEEVLAVITDVETAPSWSPQYESVQVIDTDDEGRPKTVKAKVKAAGLTDEQVVEYTWGDNTVSWTVVKASQVRSQLAKYTLTPVGDKTKVVFELTVDPSVPLPGFIIKRTLKGAMETATDGLRKQVLKVKKG